MGYHQKRRTGKSQEVRAFQPGPHIFGQRFVLRAVGFVHDHDNLASLRRIEESRVCFAFVVAEFLNQGEDHFFVLPQETAHFFGIGRLGCVFCADRAGIEKIAIDLAVQILAVGNDHKAEIALDFAEDLTSVEDHREAFARALRVPEHPQLALVFAALEKTLIGVVDTDKLMVLGDNFVLLLIKENKVLHIIQQLVRRAQTGHSVFQTAALLRDPLAVHLLFFIVHPQPVKKVFPSGAKTADPGFDRIGENAEGVGVEKLRNVVLVIIEVVVKSRAQLDVGVLQLDKDQRQAVDVKNDVGTAIGGFGGLPRRFNPELGDGEVVVGTTHPPAPSLTKRGGVRG